MKLSKIQFPLILIAVVAGLILTVAFYNGLNAQLSVSPNLTPQLPELQVFSPQNITYKTDKIPLNVTANNVNGFDFISK